MPENNLDQLLTPIKIYLETDEFFHPPSSIRSVVYNFFIESYKKKDIVTGDMISDYIGEQLSDLTNEQKLKLEIINTAWNEWRYILSKFGNPKAPLPK